MEGLFWSLKTLDAFALAWPIILNLVIALVITQTDMLFLGFRSAWRGVRGNTDPFESRQGVDPASPLARPTALVIIPSLLRNEDDFVAITMSLESAALNGYPSELTLIASVDGYTEKPELFAKLEAWVAEHQKVYPAHIHLRVTGTKTRLGKMMAVEAAVTHMQKLVDDGQYKEFPRVYFSLDGDGTLSPNALERLVHRLTTPHPITGNPRRLVSGKIYIRADLVWKDVRSFFTVAGLIHNLVAREFIVSNVARTNWRIHPQIGLPGALYCTWSDVLRTAPHYMSFMQDLRFSDWVMWLFGAPPPKFSESGAPSLPEALTGASDDTCIAFIGSLSCWVNGKLSFDAPRTPLHAIARFFRGFLFERSHDYAPDAVVYTYTPTTIKGLWTQRVRWNSSRFECAGRFWRGFWYHWELSLPTVSHLMLVLSNVVEMGVYYVLMPYLCFGSSHALLGYFMGYVGQVIAHGVYTVVALMLEPERRKYWPTLLCLPLTPAYLIGINFFGCINGVVRDLLLFGNWTNFAPEWTLRNGRTERVALLFRARRFFLLSLRALVHGDVPLGWFWLGWRENEYCPSGFDGWTTRKPPRKIFDFSALFSRRKEAKVDAGMVAAPAPPALAPVPTMPMAAPMVEASRTSRKLHLVVDNTRQASHHRRSISPPSMTPPPSQHAA